MSSQLAASRAEAAVDIAAKVAHVAALRGKLAALRRERTSLRARMAREDKRFVANETRRSEATAKARAAAMLSGKKLRTSDRMSTGGRAPRRRFESFDAEFQTKMHDIMRDIGAAEEGVRAAKAAREAMV